MFKTLQKAAAAPLALYCTFSTPVAAAEAPLLPVTFLANPAMGGGGPQSEAALMEMFAKLFDTGDKSPIDPAQLELGKASAAKLLPEGVYGQIMDQMLGTFLRPILALDTGMSGSEIASKTGIDYDAAEALTEEQRNAVTALLDPDRQARNEGALGVLKPMMTELGQALEPPMREGLARAYARKFSAAQLTQINAFFATPAGSAFAAQSFALQADPEVMAATMQAMPMMLSKMMAGGPQLEAQMKALPQERKLSELSAADLDKLAKLLGTTSQALNAYQPMDLAMDAAANAADAAADAADAAALAAGSAGEADDPDSDAGNKPWFLRDNWAPEDLAKVEKLERQASDGLDATIEAERTAIANARARLEKRK